MFPLSIYNWIEILALIASVVFYSKIKNSPLRWFILFLLMVVTVELTGRYFRKVLHQPNAWLYNISTVLEFLFYTYLFHTHFNRRNHKTSTKYFLYIYPVLAFINIVFIQGFENFHSYTMSVGSFFMILFSGFYFAELLKTPVRLKLHQIPMFWIASGILFFYLGNLLYELAFQFIEYNKLDFQHKIFQAINNNLILVLYSFFIIAFACSRKENSSP